MVIDHYREYKVINSHIKGNIYIIETEEGELIEFPIKNFPYYHRFKKGLLYLNENDEVIYSFSLNSKGKYSTQLDVEIPEVIRSKIPNLTKVSKDEKTQILHICIISSVYNYHNRSTNYIVWDYLNEKYLCLIKWRNWDLNINRETILCRNRKKYQR